jgi:tRNA (guanine26-N2/guanine27-N2)-dimethyltransferase
VGTRTVTEGLVELEFPDDARLSLARGPQRAGGGMVFYNPAARDSRDFTVVLLGAIDAPEGGWHVLDGLAGSGVRGLRVAREVGGVASVTLNDGDPKACTLASAGARRNGVEAVTVTNRSLDAVLADGEPRFDFIDIDPYGSPVTYFPRAAQRLGRGGYLALTATDMAALCGVYPQACIRRYGAVPLRNEWMKETGARILLGAVARASAAADRAVEPVATFCAQHYLRLFLRVRKGAQAAGRVARRVGFLSVDPGGERAPQVLPMDALEAGEPVPTGRLVGPLWVGDLHDRAVLARARVPEWIAPKSAVRRLLRDGPGEVGLPPWFYALDEAARRLRGSPPPTDEAVRALKAAGFRAARTHIDPKAVKTDASPPDFRRVLAEVAGGRR